MRAGYVIVGLGLILAAFSFQALARHDGILGVTPPEAYPAPGESSDGVRSRLVIDGGPQEAAELIDQLRGRGVLPGPPESSDSHTYVTAHFASSPTAAVVILRVQQPAPSVGEVVVAEGSARTYLALTGSGAAILWLHAEEIDQPILFKDA